MDSTNHRFFIADMNNNRVLVHNLNSNDTFPDRIPDYVLGQSNFYTNTAATTQSGMSSPVGLAYDAINNRLFVSQQGNHRVMVFDVATITNGMNASYVLGQPDFTSSSSAVTQAGMYEPNGMAYDSTNSRLFVANRSGHRVTVYDVATITDGENAINVLGQANFTSNSIATTATGMNFPGGAVYDSTGSRLFVSDYSNSRILVFNRKNSSRLAAG